MEDDMRLQVQNRLKLVVDVPGGVDYYKAVIVCLAAVACALVYIGDVLAKTYNARKNGTF